MKIVFVSEDVIEYAAIRMGRDARADLSCRNLFVAPFDLLLVNREQVNIVDCSDLTTSGKTGDVQLSLSELAREVARRETK
jgi:hypothetical protein